MSETNTDIETARDTQYSHYMHKWDPYVYLRDFYSIENKDWPPGNFFISNFIAILKRNSKKFENMERALDFGGGPSLWPSFLLAQYFNEIWFCDYTLSNLQCVQDWLDEKPIAYNWKPYFNYVLDTKQGHHNDETEHESRLRSALRKGKICRCDIFDSNLLLIDEQERNKKFDLIFSCACLEAASLTYDMFKETVRRLGELLKPGGILVLAGFLKATFYEFNGHAFRALGKYLIIM